MNQEVSSNVLSRPVEPLAFRSMDNFTNRFPTVTFTNAVPTPVPQAERPDHVRELRAAHERGRLEGVASAERDTEGKLQQEREAVQRTLQEFHLEKQRYFSSVESEVVKLALAIAERVLHREAEMDPLLLAGVARVALSQIADSDEAVLHVAAGDLNRWTERMKPIPKGVVFEGDESIKSGDVVLKTSSGTVDLGVRTQLLEIERGFSELLGRKPAMVV
jgi:flagellar assembly protein FliH